MTAGATEPVVASEGGMGDGDDDVASGRAAPPACVITADGTYGARLTNDGESWYPERWTLDGPEPYAVPLPSHQPEEPGTEVLPLTDGRVLIHRIADGRHTFSLLYPTGPGTGELPLGAVECPDAGTRLRLLPPAPDGERAYALAVGRGSTAVWLVAGGAFGPEHLAEVPGHCSGGVWLDGTGRLLALDRFHGGRTKTVVVDLERGGEVSPLLQIAEHSNDRLLLADADSGLLLIRSDAPSPGRERLGWGVLGSTLPVRFPECLTATGCSITPFAVQPGQVLTPEACAVALRLDGPGGTWVGMWRPSERRIDHRPAPEGWLAGTGLWTREGVLHLPYATGGVPCGVARLTVATEPWEPEQGEPEQGEPAPAARPTPRPVPLQQAPLKGRSATSRHPVVSAGPVVRTPTAHATVPAPTADLARRRLARGDAGFGLTADAVADTGQVAPAEGVRHLAGPAETPGVEASWAGTSGDGPPVPGRPDTEARGAGTTGTGTTRAGTPGAETAGAGRPDAVATGVGPYGDGAPVEAGPAPGSARQAWLVEPVGPVERVAPQGSVPPVAAPEPAEPRAPKPALWTKVAATPPPGRSLGAGFIATLPVEIEARPARADGNAEMPPLQAEFSDPPQLPDSSRPPGPQPFPEPARPVTSQPGQYSGSQPFPESVPLPDPQRLPEPPRLTDTPEVTGPPEFTRYTDVAHAPGAGAFADFTEFRGETPLRSFGNPEGPESPEGHDRTEPQNPPGHQDISARRTPHTHRRPLHAGPPMPAAPAPAGTTAPPAAGNTEAEAVSADPETAVPGPAEEAGGEDEETSPSGTRTMTAR